ncbi:MAG: prohibitin family protein [Chloroflexi bacterium]|nr:prohibitin family protein [Chloroflexota bacterium]
MEALFPLIGFALFLAGVGGLIFSSLLWPRVAAEDERGRTIKAPREGRSAARIGSVAAVILGIFLLSIRIVPAGSVGVVKHWQTVDDNEASPGISLQIPFATDIVVVDTRVQAIPFERLGAASREYQDVFLTGVLNIHVAPQFASDIYQNIGLDYRDKVVIPFYANIVKEIVPQFGVAEVLPQREQIRIRTVEKLKAKLEPLGIIVDDVALANVDFNDAYNQAIQNKQVQELQVATERNILEQRKVQAEQAKAAASGEAQAQVERAKGDAESVRLHAQAEADANRLIGASLTEQVLRSRQIDALGDKVQVIYLPVDSNTILPLPSARP